MQMTMLKQKTMPYCPGCSHHGSTLNLAKALEKAGYNPLDVIIVSDIGCCGIIDSVMNCHTVHGLHGRAVALAAGVTMGIENPDKKVVVIQGDGGATIGLQHLMEACRRNFNMTLLVLNNMVYGMTGGQVSGLTDSRFKEKILPEEAHTPPYDIVELASKAGAAYAARLVGRGEYSDKLVEAIRTKGFSMVEIVGPCPSYAYQGTKDIIDLGYKEKVLTNNRVHQQQIPKERPSLFEKKTASRHAFKANLKNRVSILVGGSAGEGVQLAADLLAQSGLNCSLNTTKKGEYPITVGTGFSLAEVILSNDEINFSGIENVDVAIVTSPDGWDMVKPRLNPETVLIVDNNIEIPSGITAIKADFREKAGRKSACLCAIAYWLIQKGILPLGALTEAISGHKHHDKLMEAIQITNVL